MDPWTERQHARVLPPMSMVPWAATKRVDMTLAPVRVPYPTAACPELHFGYLALIINVLHIVNVNCILSMLIAFVLDNIRHHHFLKILLEYLRHL